MAGAMYCDECPAGAQCTATTAQNCTIGYYSLARATACKPCPPGK